jgi:tRNA (mo5U34)-methyltransferase
MTTAAELVRLRADWFHSIDFGDGVVSPGVVPLASMQQALRHFHFPDRLDGLRVLDIGTYDGFFAFEAERRSAGEVVAIDVNPIDYYCFGLAKRILGSKVQFHHMSVYALDPERLGGPFDLVLFPGVFYHLRHILLALDNLWGILKPDGSLIMETHVCDNQFVLGDGTVTTLQAIDPRLEKTPLFRFYRRDDLAPGDWSNWFGGNAAAILDCLGSAGFQAELLATWAPGRASFRATKINAPNREWEHGSYEGIRYVHNQEGEWTAVWCDPETRERQVLRTSQHVALPGYRGRGDERLATLPPGEKKARRSA